MGGLKISEARDPGHVKKLALPGIAPPPLIRQSVANQ
jgi:hypothetical protein